MVFFPLNRIPYLLMLLDIPSGGGLRVILGGELMTIVLILHAKV